MTILLKLVDTFAICKDAYGLFELLDCMVKKMWFKWLLITAYNYSHELLMKKREILFWSAWPIAYIWCFLTLVSYTILLSVRNSSMIACPCLVLGDGECEEDNSSGLENLRHLWWQWQRWRGFEDARQRSWKILPVFVLFWKFFSFFFLSLESWFFSFGTILHTFLVLNQLKN